VAVGSTSAVRDRRGPRRPFPLSVPLLTVLALQTVLSLRLIWSKTAFNDEALYLWAGHLELAHILHGTPVPGFQTYFSGAPFIYPPLAALADSLGGLAAARILSLTFMLGATVLLYGTSRPLFGRRAGEIAAGSFGLLGSAEFLGAFATYDAMALFLLALATYPRRTRGHGSRLPTAGGTWVSRRDSPSTPVRSTRSRSSRSSPGA